jgi:hypothetical protein
VASQKRRTIASGLMLILIGFAVLAFQIFPVLSDWIGDRFTWPMSIWLVAAGLLVIGVLAGTAEMLIPASIVGGIGTILYLQNEGILLWESWAYLWTLIPGFVGIGVLLSGLIQWKGRQMIDGVEAILVSAVLFFVFASLFGDMFGFLPFQDLLPIFLIALGVFLFLRALLDRGRPSRDRRSVE